MDDLEFETLTADELKVFMDTHGERSYLLIDVRQPLEYERGHLAGATLMPLMEIEADLFSLPPDKNLIFYCTNGGRSQWAASLAAESEVCNEKVYHLMGGLHAWENETLSGYPKVQIFSKDQNFKKPAAWDRYSDWQTVPWSPDWTNWRYRRSRSAFLRQPQ